MKFAQYKHQAKEYDEHRDDEARAYFWQMRTGKSKMVIDNACYLEQQDKIDGVIVLAPNGVHLNWLLKELPAHHWTGDYEAFAWQFSSKTAKADFAEFLEQCALSSSCWLALNMESMTRAEIKTAIDKFRRLCPRHLFVVDESHHFRTPGAKRTARARAMARRATYRRILSGSSLDNSPLHAFSQYELLAKAALGYDRFEDFKIKFSVWVKQRMKNGRSFEKLDKYINLEELKHLIAPYTSVVLREDCEDLPELIRDPRYLVPSTEQLRLHRAISKGLILEMEEVGLYDGKTGGAKLNKLQQVLSGFVYADDGSVTHIKGPNPRLEACKEEVLLHDGKVIIWCRFTQDIVNVREMLKKEGIKTVEYHGKMRGGNDARVEALEKFANDPAFKVLIGQPQAGGEGRDMSAASKIIWYSHTSDNIVRSQADERATIIGGEHIQVVDLVVPDSIDTYWLELLEERRTIADDVSRYGLRAILEKVEL